LDVDEEDDVDVAEKSLLEGVTGFDGDDVEDFS
jgi:hypothetical protein